jgi:molecular chaperone HscB
VSDPFQLLGLEPRFDLDLRELDERHKRQSLLHHPDRLRDKSAQERRHALSMAMSINEAHRALRDPVSRALALLDVLGPGRAVLPNRPLGLDDLETILERRETLSYAKQKGDVGRITELKLGAERARDAALSELKDVFLSSDPFSASSIERIDGALTRLRYHDRFLSEIDSGEE